MMPTRPTAPLPAALPPLRPAEASYLATSTWETYAAGDFQTTTITRTLHVQVQPVAQGLALTLEVAPPTLRGTPEPEPLTELARQLATLYGRLELLLTPTGEVAALLNYDALRQGGQQLLGALHAAAAPDDQLTATLLAFAGRQLASPAAVLQSLAFDYLYQALLPGAVGLLPARPRQFAGFFDKTPLWFAEQATVAAAPDAELLDLRLHGPLDAGRTNLAAVQAGQARALRLATPPGATPVPLPAPHFCYEAAYTLAAATGLPHRAELLVYARAGQLLNKEYHLTLERV